MTDTVDKVIIQSSSEGTDQATSELQGLAKAYDGVTVASQSTERATVSAESKFSSLERRLGTSTGQMSQFEKGVATINVALAQNPALQDRAYDALGKLEQRYGGVSQVLQKQRDQLAQVAAVQKTVDATTGVVGLSDSSARATDIENYGKQLDNLRAKYNPLFSAQQSYKASLAEINNAAKVGALTEAERAAAIMNTKVAFVEQVNSIRGVTEAEAAFAQGAKVAKTATDELSASHAGLSNYAQTLAHAVRGGTEQLLLGVSPTRALTSEMNHLAYASTGPGGLSGAFSELTGFFGKMITPTVAVTAGVVALGAGALYLGNSWQEAQSKVNQSLIGIGERTGTTAADINAFAKANSTATGLSITAARDLGIELTKTGNVSIASLTGVGAAVHGYSILTGKDATQATKDFASALSGDLVEGIKKLDAPYGSLNADTLEHIRNLDLQSAGALDASAKTQALQAWIDGLASTNKKAAESVGGLSQAYQLLSNVMAGIKNGPVPADPRTQAQANLEQATRDRQAGEANGAAGGAVISRNARGELTQPTTIGRNANGEFVDVTAGLDDLKAKEADAQAALDSLNAKAAAAQLRALSEASDSVVHSFLPQIDAIHNLDKAISTLQLAQQKGVAAKGSDDALTVLQYQRDAAQDVLDKTIQQATVVGDLQTKYGDVSAQTAITLNNLQGQLAVASQRTVQGQIQAQEQAQINDLLAQGVSAEEAASIAAAQRAVSEEKVYQNMQKAVDASRDQVALYATQGSSEQASVKAAIAYRNAIDSGADSTQAGIIAINTATVATAQWAAQAQKAAEAFENAARAAHDAQYADITPGGDNSFGFFQTKEGLTGTSVETIPYFLKQSLINNSTAPPDATTMANNILKGGGSIDSAIAGIQGLSAGTTSWNNAAWLESYLGYQPGQLGLSKSTTITQSDIVGLVGQLYTAKNAQTSDKSQQAANLQDELKWLQTQPQTIDTLNAINSLKSSIDSLTGSTNSLTSVNQDLLSPYYSQDPRTSHIGFRSQGMATGGELTVPGGYSANDNMLAQIPVASGEIVSVRRPGQSLGGSSTQTINLGGVNITINGNVSQADANAIGRTAYQGMQSLLRQQQAAAR